MRGSVKGDVEPQHPAWTAGQACKRFLFVWLSRRPCASPGVALVMSKQHDGSLSNHPRCMAGGCTTLEMLSIATSSQFRQDELDLWR